MMLSSGGIVKEELAKKLIVTLRHLVTLNRRARQNPESEFNTIDIHCESKGDIRAFPVELF